MQCCKVYLQRYRKTSGQRNFIKQTKAPIFLEAVLAVEIKKDTQSDLVQKVNPSLLKIIFFKGQTH